MNEKDALTDFHLKAKSGNRLTLLREMAALVLFRRDSKESQAIRNEWLQKEVKRKPRCFSCGRPSQSRQFVISPQHGGTNTPRNIVSLCKRCATTVHPWML